jgi:hypothetical protein
VVQKLVRRTVGVVCIHDIKRRDSERTTQFTGFMRWCVTEPETE